MFASGKFLLFTQKWQVPEVAIFNHAGVGGPKPLLIDYKSVSKTFGDSSLCYVLLVSYPVHAFAPKSVYQRLAICFRGGDASA